jgi:hypothetical protein
MTSDAVVSAALGERADAFQDTVSLATPLTLGRVVGRDRAVAIIRKLVDALGVRQPEYVAEDEERTIVTFLGLGQGREVGLMVVLSPGEDGRYRAVDMYARPYPFVALVREKLAADDELFRTDVDLSTPYVPSGPTESFLAPPPALPDRSTDVAFHSPVLTETATGGDLVKIILGAVEEVSGPPHFRYAKRVGDSIVVLYDARVHGHAWQLGAVFGLNGAGEINDMCIYSRPWPVSGLFRAEVYQLLRDTLGPEFWQGESPSVALEREARRAGQ